MLNLEALPVRIECFDISNLGEQATVASMVVFEQGMPKKADYRISGSRHGQGQDDFASMAEAVRRRFTRLANAESADDGYDPGVRGGAEPGRDRRRQGPAVGGARRARRRSTCRASPAIGLAKRIEEVFVPGRREPIVLPRRLAGAAAAAAHPRRGAPVRAQAPPPPRGRRRAAPTRCSTRCRASARRASARCSSTSARPARARGARRRARGRARPAAQDGPRDPRLPEQDGRRRRRRDGTALRRLRGARLGPRRGGVPRRRARAPRAAARRRRAAGRRAPRRRRSRRWSTGCGVLRAASARPSRTSTSAPTLAWAGVTPFEERCLRELQRDARTARRSPTASSPSRAGRERAHRAAGTVCARGTLSLVVPYHRVIRADGSIGEWGPDGQRVQAPAAAPRGGAPVEGRRGSSASAAAPACRRCCAG